MGFLSGLFRTRDAPQNRTAGSNYAFYLGGSTSGKMVNERSAMQMTAVYACVRILAEAIAGLPLHLYKYTDEGGKEKALDHPLYLLLHDEPNPEMSSFVFRETLMTHLLLWGNRALVTPGTKLEVYFSLGSSPEAMLGVFYIDRAQVSYPEESVSVSARNAVGKLLKEQTFDEQTVFDFGSLQDNIRRILELAEVEDFFVGDPGVEQSLEFERDTTLLEGLKYAISLLANWKIGETAEGVVGVAPATDARFDPPEVYAFSRDRNCWSYSIEYDDKDAASRVCVYSKGKEETDPEQVAYENVEFNKWWSQPEHRTLYVQTVDGASHEQVVAVAHLLAESLAASGRQETFAGIFTPQLTTGDEVHVTDERGGSEVIGAVTDVTHNFGQNGFYTQFTVDSGGRRGRTRLKDLITNVADFPEAFTGVHHTTPVEHHDVEFRNAAAFRGTNAETYTYNINALGGNLVVAHCICRTPSMQTPEGWTRLFYSDTLIEGTTTQYSYVFYKETDGGMTSATFNMGGTFWLIVNFTAFAYAGMPYVTVNPSRVTAHSMQAQKNTYDPAIWAFHNIYWNTGTGYKWTVSGVEDLYLPVQAYQHTFLGLRLL